MVDRLALTGTGELRMMNSRVSWMLFPVDRSIAVSAPQIVLHCSFSTSCTCSFVDMLLHCQGCQVADRSSQQRIQKGVQSHSRQELAHEQQGLATEELRRMIGDAYKG